jgi:YcaO-like protein with predicted kinase domain
VPLTTSLWARLSDEPSGVRHHFGTRRAVPPEETLRRIAPLLAGAGITRLADVTGLDRVGIPVYQAIRPNSRNLTVSQGKGLTRAQAKASALMESFEGFHAEAITQPSVRASVGAMHRDLAYDPFTLALSKPSFLNAETTLDWIEATDLFTGAPTWVPRQLCELDFRFKERLCVPLFHPSSNGLASGNTTAEALVHGLCEVIERDASWRHDQGDPEAERTIALSTVHPRLAQRVLGLMAVAGLEPKVVDTSGPTGLPSFEATLHDPESPVLSAGAGCHPSRLTALLRALTEAIQSRLAVIAGSRDDIVSGSYAPVARTWRRPWPAAARHSFRSAPTVPLPGFAAQVRDIVDRVRAQTGMSPMAVDLLRPDFGIPVVFVVAPGLRSH